MSVYKPTVIRRCPPNFHRGANNICNRQSGPRSYTGLHLEPIRIC